MVSDKTLQLLAQLVGNIGTTPIPTSNVDIAKSILLRSQIDFGGPNLGVPKVGKGGPSVVSRIFDILSRPNYAMAGMYQPVLTELGKEQYSSAFKETLPNKSWPRAFRGITGKDKKTFTKFVSNIEHVPVYPGGPDLPRPAKIGAGLALDIGLDPLTYVPLGWLKTPFTIAKSGSKGKGVIPKVTEQASKLPTPIPIPSKADYIKVIEQEVLNPFPSRGVASVTSKFPPYPEHVSTKNIPSSQFKYALSSQQYGRGYTSAFAEKMKRISKETQKANDPTYFGQVQRAEQLLDRIARASPQAVKQVTPKQSIEKIKLNANEKNTAIRVAKSVIPRLRKDKGNVILPRQQLVLFRSLLHKTTGTPDQRMSKAIAMLRIVEKQAEETGHTFSFWDGTRVRLSTIFDELGGRTAAKVNLTDRISPEILQQIEKGDIVTPALDQAIEAARARSALDDAEIVKLALDRVTKTSAHVQSTMSAGRAESVIQGLARELSLGLEGADISIAGQKTAQEIFKEANKFHISQIQGVMTASQKVAHDIMNRKATIAAKLTREQKINKEIERHLGSPFRILATKMGNENKVLESIGSRLQAHYGHSALRPIAQDHLLSAQASAGMRARTWRDLVKGTSPEARREALSHAQRIGWATATKIKPKVPKAKTKPPRKPSKSRAWIQPSLPPASQEVMDIAIRFRTSIENLFSSTGVKDTAQSVSTRAAFTMDDINAELRRIGSDFQFTNGRVVDDLTKEVRDFSNDVDWLKSWETHNLKSGEDPVTFINQLETAAEKVSKRYAIFDDVAARFGSTRRTGPFRYLVDDPRLAGWYFTEEIATQINYMNSVLKNVYQPGNDFVKFMDRVTSSWKSGVTIYSPSHHIRNLIGDVWLGWIAGVNNPQAYSTAIRILRTHHHRYGGSIPVEQLVAKDAFTQATARATGKPETIVVRTKDGIPLSSEQVYIAAFQRGLLLNARSIEDIFGEPLMPKLLGGKAHALASGTAEVREHYVKLAHFTDAIKKSKGDDIKSILDNAAHTVRKWHPDGMDLTNFERKYLRRIFPFYSWYRKAFPLVFEAMIMKPGKVVAYPKGMEAFQELMGVDASRTDPFPEDQIFPDWIREKGIGPIAKTGMEGPGGFIAGLSRQGVDKGTGQEIGGYTIVNPSNPMIDLIAQFGGSGKPNEPLKGLGAGLHPGLRIPMELTTNQQIHTGVPVSYDPARYATEQVPPLALASRLANVGIAGPTQRGQREGMGNTEAIINFLTASGLLGTGPHIETGRRETQKRISKSRKKRREEFLSGID